MPLISPAALWLNEVAKAGSIRAAAARINISPSAINRQILNLEAEFGTQLFERLPRGVRLTAAGEVLVAEIRGWLNDQEKARRHLSELRGMVRGHASIGMMESFATRLVSDLMTFMRERRTHVSVDIVIGGTSHLVDQVVAGKLDLAICYAVSKHSGLQVLASVNGAPGIVVGRDHPLASKKKVRLSDCADYTFVLPDHTLTVRRTLDAAFEAASFAPLSIVTTGSVSVMKMLVRDHGQIAVLSIADVHQEVLDGQLVHIPFADHFVIGSQLSLVAAKNTRLSPVASMLADHVREFLNDFAAAP